MVIKDTLTWWNQGRAPVVYKRLAIDQGDVLLLEEADLVGIGDPKKHLIEWLLKNETGHQVVLVVGNGGGWVRNYWWNKSTTTQK